MTHFSAADREILTSQFANETVTARPAFPKEEYRHRRQKLQDEMRRRGIALVLLSSPEAQCWLHGYQARWYRTGSTTQWPPVNYTAFTHDGTMLVIDTSDHKALIQFTSVAAPEELLFPTSPDPSLPAIHDFIISELRNRGMLTPNSICGIEKWSPRSNAATTADLINRLGRNGLNVVAQDITVSMRNLQRIKSPAEINVLRSAGTILDRAYEHLVDEPQRTLHPSMTEIQVWAEMEYAMARNGGETAGLHNTVSRARHYYHALSSTRPIGEGQLHLDPSAVLHRYHVNTARQFFLEGAGTTAPRLLIDASKVAAEALDIVLHEARVGMGFGTLSRLLRAHYKASGLWESRDWIGGYQLGIAFPPDWVGEFVWDVDEDDEQHEKPLRDPEDIEPAGERVIEDGLVTNFESFVGGAGFIDTIVFHEGRANESLSTVPREIQVIPAPRRS